MTIERFRKTHIDAAQRLALQEYQHARRHFTALPALPDATPHTAAVLPDLAPFAENGLGVAALEDGKLVGYLCAVSPFSNCFRSTDAVGVFSPLGANAAVSQNRAKIYAAMLQAAAARWTAAGASSHALCLYAQDAAAQRQGFFYGYGLRCMDAIQRLHPDHAPDLFAKVPAPCRCRRLPYQDFARAFSLQTQLDEHMAQSPTFIRRPSLTLDEFRQAAKSQQAQYFLAETPAGEPVAYLRVSPLDGETFIRRQPGYIHIDGMYCLPAWRGTGTAAALLQYAAQDLYAQGYAWLGVDFESINPAGHGFWRKYFQIYTHSLTRRIDEHALPSCN